VNSKGRSTRGARGGVPPTFLEDGANDGSGLVKNVGELGDGQGGPGRERVQPQGRR